MNLTEEEFKIVERYKSIQKELKEINSTVKLLGMRAAELISSLEELRKEDNSLFEKIEKKQK